MKYQNFQTCNNCGKENALYANKCENCHHYVRANIVNIDLWSTIWNLFESPVEALENIIYAQHKNFIIFLTIFVSIKFLLISAFLQSLKDDSVTIRARDSLKQIRVKKEELVKKLENFFENGFTE